MEVSTPGPVETLQVPHQPVEGGVQPVTRQTEMHRLLDLRRGRAVGTDVVHGHRDRDTERPQHEVPRLVRDLAVQVQAEVRVAQDEGPKVRIRNDGIGIGIAADKLSRYRPVGRASPTVTGRPHHGIPARVSASWASTVSPGAAPMASRPTNTSATWVTRERCVIRANLQRTGPSGWALVLTFGRGDRCRPVATGRTAGWSGCSGPPRRPGGLPAGAS